MLNFFRLMVPIAMLRRSPAAIPYSHSLCLLALGWVIVLSFFFVQLMGYDGAQYARNFVLSVLFSCSFIYIILAMRKKRARFLQTITASFGVSAVLLLVEIVLAMLVAGEVSQVLTAWLFFLVLVWSLLIDTHIFSSAMEIDRFPAAGVALVLFLIQASALQALSTAS